MIRSAVVRIRAASRRRKVVVAAVLVLVVWGVFVAIALVSSALALRDGARQLRAARGSATVSHLLEPETVTQIDGARRSFDAAERAVSNPLLAPARIVPILGRHIRAVDHLATSGRDGTAAAIVALEGLQELEEQPHGAGPERLALLERLAQIAGDGAEALDEIDPGSSAGLVGPLADTVEQVRDQRDDGVRAAGRLRSVADGLSELLTGPETYLLLGANNAEMRTGSGMFLSAAPLELAEGHARLGDVEPTADLVLEPGVVTAEGDLQANWGWLDPGSDLRQQGLSADFPQSAALAVQTWAAATDATTPTGVVVIDVDGIRALLRAVGPVEVDGIRYTPDNVRGELLREQYRRFEGERDGRRDQLGAIAEAIFERIEAGEWRLGELATQLVDAAAGRHLLVWSADEQLGATWADLGVDGHLSQDSLAVNLVNRGANKLDSWVDTGLDVVTKRDGDGHAIELRYTITNRSTGEGPRYLVGPGIEGIEAGDYRGLVVANLPAGTTDVVVEGDEPFLSGGDGPTVVVGVEVTVRAGEERTVTVRAKLAAGVDRLVIEPAARIAPTKVSVDQRAFERDRRRTVAIGG